MGQSYSYLKMSKDGCNIEQGSTKNLNTDRSTTGRQQQKTDGVQKVCRGQPRTDTRLCEHILHLYLHTPVSTISSTSRTSRPRSDAGSMPSNPMETAKTKHTKSINAKIPPEKDERGKQGRKGKKERWEEGKKERGGCGKKGRKEGRTRRE